MSQENPAFTLYANDIMHWEPIQWLSDAQLGQVFKLIVYACKLHSRVPKDHPLLTILDAKVIALCCRDDGDALAVIRPVDLPKLMLARETYLQRRRDAAAKGGRRSAQSRRSKHGTAQPGKQG